MAIVVEQTKKKVSWFGIGVTLLILAIIIIGGYYLFFTEAPAIQIIIPQPLQTAGNLEKIKINPADVVNDQRFRQLREIPTNLNIGTTGRDNPFQSF